MGDSVAHLPCSDDAYCLNGHAPAFHAPQCDLIGLPWLGTRGSGRFNLLQMRALGESQRNCDSLNLGELKLVGEMSFELPGAAALDEQPCRYGSSKLLCRGPQKPLDAPYVAFLGGSETYGKFVQHPFSALIEDALAKPCVNLGSVNAGLDAFVHDPEMLRIASGADLTVVQVLGAQNLSNRFYRVHPRRNDRFLEPSAMMSSIYGEVDFTEFHFNKHLLCTLHNLSEDRFGVIREELQEAWLGRMRLLLQALGPRTVLLWLRYRQDRQQEAQVRLGPKPHLVTRSMIDALRPSVQSVVEVPIKPARQSGELGDMIVGPMQMPAAGHMIGPGGHQEIASRLLAELRPGE